MYCDTVIRVYRTLLLNIPTDKEQTTAQDSAAVIQIIFCSFTALAHKTASHLIIKLTPRTSNGINLAENYMESQFSFKTGRLKRKTKLVDVDLIHKPNHHYAHSRKTFPFLHVTFQTCVIKEACMFECMLALTCR